MMTLFIVQETPDSPEALSCVPTLLISDIPKEASSIPTALEESQGVTLLNHDLFTNDILYMEVALDMRPLPADLLPLMPLFCRCSLPTTMLMQPEFCLSVCMRGLSVCMLHHSEPKSG